MPSTIFSSKTNQSFLFQQLGLLTNLLDPSQSSTALDSPSPIIPDFVKLFNSFTPEALELLCIEPLINLIPNDPVLNYIFGVGRLFELINTFMTIITSTNEIRCQRNPNKDYAEISQFLRLNKTVLLVRENHPSLLHSTSPSFSFVIWLKIVFNRNSVAH